MSNYGNTASFSKSKKIFKNNFRKFKGIFFSLCLYCLLIFYKSGTLVYLTPQYLYMGDQVEGKAMTCHERNCEILNYGS